ncbi:UDP-N-acetylglucosamine 2-epimerase (non-hydrolyzing) [Desulfococcaceae bacterium HSG7]|nr:UDP-N-acetylglucosamine 2-epimerase (non-hydrolyzing) [Desulfococcaceae bacterium HSG7]
MKIINVVGTRPNFVKIAPLMKEMRKYKWITPLLVHTGQHYDVSMSQDFFRDLEIPTPDITLEVGSGSHARQTAKIMMRFEKVLLREKPDLVIVVGDVNSTMACAITAKKLLIKTAHVEAGLRSRDMAMPEEINRVVTDAITDYFFTTSKIANENLKAEGADNDKIFHVGNIMIDTLMLHLDAARALDTYTSFGLEKSNYALLTMHRPANVDNKATLENLLGTVNAIGKRMPVIFPAHPRTMMNIKKFGFDNFVNQIQNFHQNRHLNKNSLTENSCNSIHICSPLKYRELLNLTMNSKFVITDSGGLQEETTVCGVPCLTIRKNTERPETVTIGSNVVVGTEKNTIMENVDSILSGAFKKGGIPELWDGKTAQRIVKVVKDIANR